jgi:hypothetical protein
VQTTRFWNNLHHVRSVKRYEKPNNLKFYGARKAYGRIVLILNNRKIVIDTDAGLDDAQAILMALASDNVDVVAITTVLGNTTAPQVANNVLRILKMADRLDVSNYF